MILTAALLPRRLLRAGPGRRPEGHRRSGRRLLRGPQDRGSRGEAQILEEIRHFDLGFNQTALWSWASGGYNSATLRAGIDANANYAKDLATWTNRLQMMYGFLWSADKENLIQKSADLLQFESRFGYKTSEESKWKYTADLTVKSQFSDSYDSYKQDDNGKWSGSSSPASSPPAT